jgi:hypothetical protein
MQTYTYFQILDENSIIPILSCLLKLWHDIGVHKGSIRNYQSCIDTAVQRLPIHHTRVRSESHNYCTSAATECCIAIRLHRYKHGNWITDWLATQLESRDGTQSSAARAPGARQTADQFHKLEHSKRNNERSDATIIYTVRETWLFR